MKNVLVLAASVMLLQAIPLNESPAHGRLQGGVTVSLGVFYDELSPHGEWIPCGGGVYGWRPVGVHAGWRPYTVGRWCWTDDGWYWLSDEPWGWATFHYGRWHYDDYYGWIWIPGYDWAPAWVEWRYGGGCVGWAPLSPYAVFSVSWGIHYRTRWYTPVTWWNFVDCGYIASPNVHRYVYRNEHNPRYVGNTRGGGSVRYDGGRVRTRGPEREYIEREGRTRIEQVGVRDIGDRRGERIRNEGGRSEIEVYRPHIEARSDDAVDASRPARVREERGRTLGLDTRKIDGRPQTADRTDNDVRRSEEFRQRQESERRAQERVDGDRTRETLGRPGEETRSREAVDSPTRRTGRTREDEKKEDRTVVQPRGRSDEGRTRESAPQPRERRRENVYYQSDQGQEQRPESPQPRQVEERRREYSRPERRSDAGITVPERRTEPRMEMPRREAPRGSNSGRSDGGRSESGRSRGR